MTTNILIAHYILWAILLLAAGLTLKAHKGVSLLSIYTICLALQMGTAYAGLSNAGPIIVSEVAIDRFGLSLILSYLILIIFLLGMYRYGDRSKETLTNPPVGLSSFWMGVGLVLVVAVLGIRMFSASGNLVSNIGFDTLGGEGYYELRGQIIESETENVSRLAVYFEAAARAVLLLMLTVTGLELARKFSRFKALFYLILLLALIFGGMLRFEKAPLVWVLTAGVIPFLLPKPGERAVVRTMVKLGAAGLAVMLVSITLYAVTEGLSFGVSVEKVFDRIFGIPSYTSCLYFDVYPDVLPHVNWADFRPVRLILGNDSLLPLEGSLSIDVAVATSGFLYNANAAFIAGSWAEAGYLGVGVVTLIMATFCVVLDRSCARVRRRLSLRPLAIYYWLGFVIYGNSGFINVVLDHGLWLVPVFYCQVLGRQRGCDHDSTKLVSNAGEGSEHLVESHNVPRA